MSHRLLYGGDIWIHCDAEGCSSEILGVGSGVAATLDDAYEAARQQGWVRRNRSDCCPDHVR